MRYGPPAHEFLIDLLVRIGDMFYYADEDGRSRTGDGRASPPLSL